MSTPTILIADDDAGLLSALECRLSSTGYRVLTTQDGYQTLAIARRERPDLLILDINMPAGSGMSVLERIESIDELSNPPVIFMTGCEITDSLIHKADAHNAVILQKPFVYGSLLATIRERMAPNQRNAA
jgi:DNA-binding response OmpR family regulator